MAKSTPGNVCSELLKEALPELILIFLVGFGVFCGFFCSWLIQSICSVVGFVHELWEIKGLLSKCSTGHSGPKGSNSRISESL